MGIVLDKEIIINWSMRLMIAAATLLRLWLAGTMNFLFVIGTWYDDWLQMNLVSSLLAGKWLGNYGKCILCKNISFPLFVAFFRRLHIPYGVALGILICISSALFVCAIRPIVGKFGRAAIYTILVFLPVGMGSSSVIRIYRNAIQPWCVLLVLAFGIGTFLRINGVVKDLLIWSAGYFCALPFFWYLREDSIWIVPLVLGMFCASVIKAVVLETENMNRLITVVLLIIPFFGIIFTGKIIAEINKTHYGVPLVTDRVNGYENNVVKLLYQIDGRSENEDPTIWVSKEALQLAVDNSPTLASMNGLFEKFEAWGGDQGWTHGDMATWALREAVADNGHFSDLQETQNVYRAIYEELQDAFAQGMLTKKKSLFAGTLGVGASPDEIRLSIKLTMEAIPLFAEHFKCDQCGIKMINGSEADIQFAEKILGVTLPRTDERLQEIGSWEGLTDINTAIINDRTVNEAVSTRIVKSYQNIARILKWVAALAYMAMTILLSRKKSELFNVWLIATASLLTAVTNLFTAILFFMWRTQDVMGYDVEYYASSAFVLLTIFIIMSIYGCGSFLLSRCRGDKKID